MNVVFLADREKLQEDVDDQRDWTYANRHRPLLDSQSVVGVDAESSSSEGDEKNLQNEDADDD